MKIEYDQYGDLICQVKDTQRLSCRIIIDIDDDYYALQITDIILESLKHDHTTIKQRFFLVRGQAMDIIDGYGIEFGERMW